MEEVIIYLFIYLFVCEYYTFVWISLLGYTNADMSVSMSGLLHFAFILEDVMSKNWSKYTDH